MASTPTSKTHRSMRRTLFAGTAVTALLTCGMGGWAASTTLAGAVIAPGALVVDTNLKKVQHPTGGVVGELNVRDGSEVRTGEILVRLDDTITRANLGVITKSIDGLTARQSRLKAEQETLAGISFADELIARKSDAAIGNLINEEMRLFEVRRAAREGQIAQFKERIAQLREQIQGTSEQVLAKAREVELIGQELKGIRELWEKKMVALSRLIALERDSARLQGERGALISSIAQTKGKITETELQVLQVGQDLRTEVGKDLADIRSKLAELVEKRVAAEDQLKRIDIRAPQDGVVHQLSVHTVGGVINPGEQLMLLVPRADILMVEAKILPQDINDVRLGHAATLRFSAFNQRTTPELKAKVTLVSADVSQDQKSGASFYTVRITPEPGELGRLDGLKLVPGMPVESFIQTGERTVISYLTKPLIDQVNKAWRER